MHAAHAISIAPSSTTLTLALDRGAASNDTTPPRRAQERPEEPTLLRASLLEEGLDYESGYALVLSNAAASSWRPTGRRSFVRERAASEQLRAAVYDHGPRALRHLTRRAEWDFATALRAYAKARGRAPSALGGRSLKGGAA